MALVRNARTGESEDRRAVGRVLVVKVAFVLLALLFLGALIACVVLVPFSGGGMPG